MYETELTGSGHTPHRCRNDLRTKIKTRTILMLLNMACCNSSGAL
jgi:hypothetical protein